MRATELFKDVHEGSINLNRKGLEILPGDLPDYVTGHFACKHNNLTNLVGSPKIVGLNFVCSANDLTSLDGLPVEVGGNFYCDSQINGKTFTEAEVRAHCNVKGRVYISRVYKKNKEL